MAVKKKLWGGRFRKPTDPLVERFTSSIAVDYRLARYDVIGSIAHAKMLVRSRIIRRSDGRKLVAGLTRLLRLIERGAWKPDRSAEDVHTQMQRMLEELIGAPARRLHAARSRNDQVSLDLRLYCRDAVAELTHELRAVQRALVQLGERYNDVVIPGYTHLQRAQPVLLTHHLLAYVEMLERDVERLHDARKRIDVLPLGAGALAGTSLPIDRAYVAALLGFPQIAQNSMDAVSDRDFALELVGVLASVAVHLSRLAEDMILWASEEFGIIELDDAFATGSSLMPQKKNPDVLELIRGQAGVVIGELTAFLTMMKGLPLSYNRDLQWDKRFVFGTVEQSREALQVLTKLLGTLRVRAKRATALLEADQLCATDLAEYLVRKGIAFADAHRIVGQVVAVAEAQAKRLSELDERVLRQISPQLDADARTMCDPLKSVQRKQSVGSTSPREVGRALRRWRKRLSG